MKFRESLILAANVDVNEITNGFLYFLQYVAIFCNYVGFPWASSNDAIIIGHDLALAFIDPTGKRVFIVRAKTEGKGISKD